MDSGDTYEEIQELLTAFGIPWVSSPADAEAQCAFLCSAGLVDGVISDDSDTLIYGSPIVFRHLYMGDSTVEMFKQNKIGFDRNELISLALLLGCDFTEGVRGIGPVNASEIVRHYSGIEGLRVFRDWCERVPQDTASNSVDAPLEGENASDEALREFKRKHANFRTQWLFPDDFPSLEVWNVFDKPVVSHDMEAFSWAVPDELEIMEVVTSHTDMTRAQVESILSTTMTKYRETRVQRRITDYFSPVFERGVVAEVISKRLKAALDKRH
jgi:DNA excision repair protein ERCC-5